MSETVDMNESSVREVLRDGSIADVKRLSIALAEAPGVELVAAADAHGRILAADLHAEFDHPRFANSAMDGWAVRAGAGKGGFSIVGESRAGMPYADSLALGEAVRISTGAEMPIGADAVVPVELGAEDGGHLIVDATPLPGDHVRVAGRHARQGSLIAAAGQLLGAGELAGIAAFGAAQIAVRARPRVALIAGGDELLAPGEPLVAGAIYDSNTPMLAALLDGVGAAVTSHRYASDDADAVTNLLGACATDSDVIVTAGGISVGEHDHVARAIGRLGGTLLLSGTNARPGRRMAIAEIPDGSRRVTVFCVPGNPVSSWVCFQLYVRRHLRARLGREQPRLFEAELIESVPRAGSGARVVLGRTKTLVGARSFRPRVCASDDVFAIAECNALATIDAGESVAHRGVFVECERVDV